MAIIEITNDDILACRIEPLWPLAKWKQHMRNADFDNWVNDPVLRTLVECNTKPEMFDCEALERLEDTITSLEKETGRDLNFRMGFVYADIKSNPENSTGERAVHFITMIEFDGLNYVLPRIHSNDRYTMTEPDLDIVEKSYIVHNDIQALFHPDLTVDSEFFPVAGAVMGLPAKYADENSGTWQVFSNLHRHPVSSFQNPDNPDQIYSRYIIS